MKLKELIDEILVSPEFQETQKLKINSVIDSQYIYGYDLLPYKDKILQCDEFSECTELIIANHPLILDENNNPSHYNSIKFSGDEKIKGKCILLSLSLTPEMYDPLTFHDPVKDGACITPLIYDPQTFEPHKKIILQFSPEVLQDEIAINKELVLRNELHNTLDKVLDNPELYRQKGVQHVIFRGLCEKIESSLGVSEMDLTKYNLPDVQQPEYKQVFFLDTNNTNDGDEVGLSLSSKYIPVHLSDKFIQEYGEKGLNVTRQEIEKFLTDNQ